MKNIKHDFIVGVPCFKLEDEMYSVLIVHSRHTKEYAYALSKKYKSVAFLEVKHPPTEDVLKKCICVDKIIGIGGGSVLDTAKILAGNKRCIAMPTTAAGAAVTPYATVWKKDEKTSVKTKKPILRLKKDIRINLPYSVLRSTLYDALSHAVESYWSKDSSFKNKRYAKKAIRLIDKFTLKSNCSVQTLIKAGIYAGKAISLVGTNVVHASSYPITIKYGIDHGTACGMLLPYFVKYMGFNEFPELNHLLDFRFTKIKNLNAKEMAKEIMKYKDKINNGPKEITEEDLIEILRELRVHTK